MGSRRALSVAMDHDGVTRRSEAEFSELTSRGMSAAVVVKAMARIGYRLRVRVCEGWDVLGT